MWNVHRRFITIRIPKYEKHFLVQVQNFLLPLNLKILPHKERGTIFLCWLFHLPPSCAAPVAHIFVWPLRAPKVDPSRSESSFQLHKLTFSKFPKSSACASDAWRHSHPLVNISIWDFLFWHLWTTSPPRVRVNTCAQVCTKLTHELSLKVLSLTKPKGKIYKTKSLGYYITYEHFTGYLM